MSPQLTLQTPLRLPPEEIFSYLDQLWSTDEPGKTGANTFSLLVWQPAWIEQELVRNGKIPGPILGTQSSEVIEAARKIIVEGELPHSTSPFDQRVNNLLASLKANRKVEDLRGQHVDSSISNLQPRRLITLAPTLDKTHPLETLVAAYCPLPEEGGGQSACGDVVVLRGDINSLKNKLGMVHELLPEELPSWVWWNGNLDEATDILDHLAVSPRRLVIDTALGEPFKCLKLLLKMIKKEHLRWWQYVATMLLQKGF